MIALVNRVWAAPASGEFWGPGLQDHAPPLPQVTLPSRAPTMLIKIMGSYPACRGKASGRGSFYLGCPHSGRHWRNASPLPSSVACSEFCLSPSSEEDSLLEGGLHLPFLDHSETGLRSELGFFAEGRF